MPTLSREQYNSLLSSAQREGVSQEQVNADLKKRGFDAPQPGYLDRVSAAHQERANQVQEDIALAQQGKQSGITAAISGARNLVGGAMDYLNEAPIVKPVMEGVGNVIGGVVNSAPIQALAGVAEKAGPLEPILNPVGSIAKGYGEMKSDHPELAKNIENIAGTALDISTITGVGGAVKSGAKAALSKSLAGKFPELAAKAQSQYTDDALNVISSILPRADVENVAARVSKNGSTIKTNKFGTNNLTLADDPQYSRLAKAASGYIHPANNVGENINNIKSAIGANQKMRMKLLQDQKLPFLENDAHLLPNNNPIVRAFNTPSQEAMLLFNEKSAQKVYNEVAKKFQDFFMQVTDSGKPMFSRDVAGLDKAISEFKNNKALKPFFDDAAKGGLRGEAVRDINTNVRTYISQILGPENGSLYMKIGDDLNALYTIDKLLARNIAPSVNKGVVQRGVEAVKKNPALSGLVGIGGAAGSYLISPMFIPATFSALLAGKTLMFAGKKLTKQSFAKFVTKYADDLKDAAKNAVDAAEKASYAMEYMTMQEMLDKLKE